MYPRKRHSHQREFLASAETVLEASLEVTRNEKQVIRNTVCLDT